MTAPSASHASFPERPRPRSVEELAKQQGITTPKRSEDLANNAIFETDDEVDEFLTFVRKQRDGSPA